MLHQSHSAPLGHHMLVELEGCPAHLLDSVPGLESTLIDAVTAAGAHVIKTAFHRFSPQGVSGVVIISESHVTIHSWPELGYAAIDIFTCGDPDMPDRVRTVLEANLYPTSTRAGMHHRGPRMSTISPAETTSSASDLP